MNIPENAIPLVAQMYDFLIDEGFEITFGETYLKLIESNMMDKEGNPTQFAIENGLIEVSKR